MSQNPLDFVPANYVTMPMVIGDLHFSDKYSGRHVDYFQDCIDFLEEVIKEVKNRKVTHIFFTGDLIGRTTEKNLQSRDSLMFFMKYLQLLNTLTNGNVYSVEGNHDKSQKLTDFTMFVSLGLVKKANFVDVGGVRFHLVDYGEQTRPIDVDPEKYNVAITHTDLRIEGLTTWYRGGNDWVELSSLENFYGVDFVVGGHIHNPSPGVVETSIKDKSIKLFYPGNATRPRYEKDLWDECYSLLFPTDDAGDVSVDIIRHKLKPVEEVFQLVYDDIEEDPEDLGEESHTFNIEHLAQILEELKSYNLLGETDYKTQIVRLGGIDKDAVDLALQYIETVEGEMR